MILDLSDIIKRENGQKVIDVLLELAPIEFMGEDYVLKGPVHIDGAITNNSKNLELKAEVKGVVGVRCARCARDFDTEFEFGIDEILVRDETGIVDDPDIIAFAGYEVELDPIIVDNFLMNIEGRYLCSEDCKGLCPICGCDLNVSECSCEKETIDPRWAALAEIIKDTTTE